jgi:type IV pilus assembly protein PilA
MLARIRKAQEESEGGFTLIELLVVMIIIGILAAIAIPVFLNQRKKAVDTAGKSDVSTLGKEVATYYVDNTADPTVAIDATAGSATLGHYLVNAADAGKASSGISAPALSWSSATHTSTNWCVDVTITGGTLSKVSYSATNGLALTACP